MTHHCPSSKSRHVISLEGGIAPSVSIPVPPAWLAFLLLSATAGVTPLAIYLKGWKYKMPLIPKPEAVRAGVVGDTHRICSIKHLCMGHMGT